MHNLPSFQVGILFCLYKLYHYFGADNMNLQQSDPTPTKIQVVDEQA
jgi:hypothetical protein